MRHFNRKFYLIRLSNRLLDLVRIQTIPISTVDLSNQTILLGFIRSTVATVVFRGPIFCRQCFQIPLDLILSYRFIIMFINKKSLFFTTYLIFQTRTMRIQWAIFGLKVSVWHHRRQNGFYAFWDRANLDCHIP